MMKHNDKKARQHARQPLEDAMDIWQLGLLISKFGVYLGVSALLGGGWICALPILILTPNLLYPQAYKQR